MARKKWIRGQAISYVTAVINGYRHYGLTYCSACDFLGIPAIYPKQTEVKAVM